MKKIYFVIAAFAAVALSSCEKEKDFKGLTPLGENDIAFTLNSNATRSTVAPMQGMTIKLDSQVCLEETIEDMDYASPATRGVPAYTFNVGEIYKMMDVYADYEGFGGEAAFERMDEEMIENKGWRYWHNYGSKSPWPENKDQDVNFYFMMPAQMTGLSDPEYDGGEITFTFDSPTDGAAQQDILFSHTAVSKSVHDDNLPNGSPVTMYHALTGVKFRNGHDNDGSTKTIITGVKFTGLASHGICTVTPDGEGTSKDKVTWTGLSKPANFTLNYGDTTYVPEDGADNPDGTIDYTTGSKYDGTSWTAAAADHNLNDEDGSLTFWFIPQTIDESVKLEVTFLIKTPDTKEGLEFTHIIDFGELVTENTEWKAGQLRTYTVKPFDVDVEIFDSLTDLTKDNLHVTNTGNVDEYVRIMVIGNWYGWKPGQSHSEEPSIMVGYISDGTDGDDTMVEPWYRENPVYAAGFDSTFPGGRPLASSHWKRGTGSYFYYDQVIGAGQQLSGTEALFQHYELDEDMIPTIYIPVANQTTRVAAEGVHLVMEVVVQAIPTTKPDGTEFATCWEAWSYAVGKEIKAK